MNILCQLFLAIYSLIIMAMILITVSTYSFPTFRSVRIRFTDHMIYLIVISILIATVFMVDALNGYRYRIAMLLICLSPSVFTHLTFRAKSSAMAPHCRDYYKIKSRSRLIGRIAISAYIIYIPFTLTYLQII